MVTLNATERSVLQHAANGLSNKQIAAALNRSMETVKASLISARRKMNAANTKHAIAVAVRTGLIE